MTRMTYDVLAFTFSLTACASEAPSDERPLLPMAAREDLQHTLDQVVAEGTAPGVSVTVEKLAYQRWSGAAGIQDRATNVEITPAERFRAGSMLKTAVAIATMQLVEREQLSLDARLTELVATPLLGSVPDPGAVTLRMLLDHTSGFPEFSDAVFDGEVASNPTRIWAVSELVERAFTHPMLFAPGSGWSYSNTNYIFLGEVLRQATGTSWREVLRKNVFMRAKLEHTTLPEEGNPACDGCARGYEPIEGELIDFTEVDPSMAGAAGGDAMITTPGDLATLLMALTNNELFDQPDTLGHMLELREDATIPEEGQTGYGLGITRFQVGDLELFGHLGGTAGFHGFMLIEPASGTVASGYMNLHGDLGAFILPVLDAVARLP